jgi:uncharacterized membrane protein YdcZ (DUF606 family)
MRLNRFIAALAATVCVMVCAQSAMAMPLPTAPSVVLANGQIPEPATLGILALGGAALLLRRRAR